MTVWRVPVTITDPRAGKCVNVWHVRTGGVLNDHKTELASAVASLRALYVQQAPNYPNTDTITADFAVDVETGADAALTWAAIPGTATGAVAPPHLAYCVNLKTGTRARRARGRIFLGPTVQVNQDADGSLGGGLLAGIKIGMDKLVADSLVDIVWAFCVWGLADAAPPGYWKTGGNGSELPHVARDITGWTINDRFAVMRSRRPK